MEGVWNGTAWLWKLGVAAEENNSSEIDVKVSRQGIRFNLPPGENGKPKVGY